MPLVLVVNPRDTTVTAHAQGREQRVFAATDEIDLNEVVPGFHLSVADLFREW